MRTTLAMASALIAALLLASAAYAADQKVQGETMTLPPSGMVVINEAGTDGGKSIRYTANALARKTVTYAEASSQIIVRARGGQTGGSPQLRLLVKNGTIVTTVGTQNVTNGPSYQDYTFNYSAPAGAIREVQLQSLNVATGRNLYVDYFVVKGSTLPPDADGQQAKTADSFVQSMGVVLKPNFPRYAEAHNTIIKPRIAELGIKHLRGAAVDTSQSSVYSRIKDLATTFGVRWNLVVNENIFISPPSASKIDAIVAASGNSVESFEGPNEYNNNHKTVGWGQDLRAYQCGVFNAINASQNASIPLLAPTLGKKGGEYPPYSEVPDMAACSDVNSVHAYTGGNHPTGSHDNAYDSLWFDRDVPMSLHIGAPGRPIYMTETGYTTPNSTFVNRVSEEAKARYSPRLSFECFNAEDSAAEPDANFARCYFYQLIDQSPDPANEQANYGLVAYNGTPKPAYRALENTIDILEDPGPAHGTGSLAYTLSGANSDVHQTLLQKRDGTFYLALWQEVRSYNKQTDQDISVTPQKVTVQFSGAMQTIRVFDVRAIASLGPDDDAEEHPSRTLSSVSSVTEPIGDQVKIIQVTKP